MKAADIKNILARDLQAEFALRPDWRSLRCVKVRGLRSSRPGCWSYNESTHPVLGHWIDCTYDALTVLSRDLVTVAEAQAVIDARLSERQARVANTRLAEDLVQRLDARGVQARANRGSIVVEDLVALDALLDRLDDELGRNPFPMPEFP